MTIRVLHRRPRQKCDVQDTRRVYVAAMSTEAFQHGESEPSGPQKLDSGARHQPFSELRRRNERRMRVARLLAEKRERSIARAIEAQRAQRLRKTPH